MLSMSGGFSVVCGRGWEETTPPNCAKAKGFVSKIEAQWICCCRSERQVHFAAVARIAALPLLTRFSVRQCVLRCAHDHIVPPLKEGLCAQNRR